MVTGYHSTKSSLKNTRNSRLDELIDQVSLTRDPAEKKMALEAAVLAKNEYSVIATIYVPEVWAVSSKVGGWTRINGVEGLGNAFHTITHGK